jgi:predicted permease
MVLRPPYNSLVFARAWRRLWATPVFTIFAVVSLSLGVGVTTAIYSAIAFLGRSGPEVPGADRLGFIVGTDLYRSRPSWRGVVSRPDLDDLRAAVPALTDAALSAPFYQSLVDGDVSEVVAGEAVSGNYFQIFNQPPAAGRLIQPADDAQPARVVVLSHAHWRTRFGGDAAIVGRVLRLGGLPFEVVGIAPDGFGGLAEQSLRPTTAWVPLSATRLFASGAAPPANPDRLRRQMTVIVPRPSSGSFAAISDEIAAAGLRLDREYPVELRVSEAGLPRRLPRGWVVTPVSALAQSGDGRVTRILATVMVIVGLVLVVACTNLANLVLARGAGRQHELAVRRALGASRLRLIADQVAEAGWLAAMGAIGAFVVARLMIVWFTSARLPISEAFVATITPEVDASTLLLAAGAVLASLLVFGLAPAIHLTRVQLGPVLAAEGGTGGSTRWRTRRGLIEAQVAISLSFFLIAAFAVRIVIGERTRPSGIDVDRLALGMMSMHLHNWNESRAYAAIERILQGARNDPSLQSVAVSSGMPFGINSTPTARLTTAERPFGPPSSSNDYPFAPLLAATPSIFETLGVRVVRGRAFDERDGPGTARVALVSEAAARDVFGTTDAVGRELLVRTQQGMDEYRVTPVTVIGIASDTDTQMRFSRDAGTLYLPLAQHFERGLLLVGRAAGEPIDVILPLQRIARDADPDLVVDRLGPAAAQITGAYVLVAVVSRVAAGLAVLAMVLAMAGLFGVLSHLVAKRTREMGVRMALGADAGRIRALVIGDGLRPVVGGIAIGLLVGALVRLLLSRTYQTPVSIEDVVVFLAAPLPILLSALVACYWPARRAARVDPNTALREL